MFGLLGLVACGDGGEKGTAPDAGEPLGDPLVAEDFAWTWFDFDDAFCRDGSPASIAVSLNSASPNLMIFLEGGGACFDSFSCLANPSAVAKGEKMAGLFNRTNAENPVADWNFVYVPYCTGDVHAGTNPAGVIEGLDQPQMFVGHTNMAAFLKRIVPTFPNVEQVLLTGVSAGGFGASANAPQVMKAFPNAQATLIDDSGPAMPGSVVAPCLQAKWRDTWGLTESMLAECGEDCANPDEYILDFSVHLAKTYGQRASGMIETTGDTVIRGFFGAGMNDCTGVVLLNSISEADFSAGLLALREAVQPYPKFYTFFPPGNQHTWLGGDGLFTAAVGEARLIDWVTTIINDGDAQHVGL